MKQKIEKQLLDSGYTLSEYAGTILEMLYDDLFENRGIEYEDMDEAVLIVVHELVKVAEENRKEEK